MAKISREQRREDTFVGIKATARRLMAEHGTAGLTIRGIAKEMEITPPAIYRYYNSLDDLITALIAENFNALADALETARDSTSGSVTDRSLATVLAYRRWALDNPVDFQLIYGTPIPGYHAPREITVPASTRTLVVFVALIDEALRSGDCAPRPPYDRVPPELEAHLTGVMQSGGEGGDETTLLALHLALVCWPEIHGLVILEMFGHIGPVVGNTEFFAHSQYANMLRTIGFTI